MEVDADWFAAFKRRRRGCDARGRVRLGAQARNTGFNRFHHACHSNRSDYFCEHLCLPSHSETPRSASDGDGAPRLFVDADNTCARFSSLSQTKSRLAIFDTAAHRRMIWKEHTGFFDGRASVPACSAFIKPSGQIRYEHRPYVVISLIRAGVRET